MKTPSAGALQATLRLKEELAENAHTPNARMAQIIDEQTGLKELVEALEEIMECRGEAGLLSIEQRIAKTALDNMAGRKKGAP